MGNVLGKGHGQLLHLRRMGVCRSLVLNKKENGQDFFSRRFGNGLFAGGRGIRGLILFLPPSQETRANAAKTAVKGMRFCFIMMIGWKAGGLIGFIMNTGDSGVKSVFYSHEMFFRQNIPQRALCFLNRGSSPVQPNSQNIVHSLVPSVDAISGNGGCVYFLRHHFNTAFDSMG